MAAPASSSIAEGAPISSGAKSRLSGILLAAVREAGWIARELAVGSARCAMSAWSAARQRRLEARRRAQLQAVGEALRQADLPPAMRDLAAECAARESEITEHRAAVASKSAPLGALARFARKRRLSKSIASRDASLRRLGEAGVSLATTPQRDALLAVERAISEEQARRRSLAEPWRALSPSRKLAVIGALLLILAAAIFVAWRAWNARVPTVSVEVAAAKAKMASRSPARTRSDSTVEEVQQPPPKVDKARATADFLQQRKTAAAGTWVVYGANPVLVRGDLGQWDDFKVGSPVVLKDGNQYRMWYRGCHLRMLEYTCGIGHAVSSDGISWTKSPRPVLVPSDPGDVSLLNAVAVVKAKDSYWMWYAVSADAVFDRPYADIHLATSKDGLTWQAAGPVLRAVTNEVRTLAPSAWFDGTNFHLWYRDHASEGVEAVMHVTSPDGSQWQIAGYTFSENIKKRATNLSVLAPSAGGYRALYVPAAMDRRSKEAVAALDLFVSADGSEWRPSDTPSALPSEPLLNKGERASGLSLVESPDGISAWVASLAPNGAEDIRLVFLKGAAP